MSRNLLDVAGGNPAPLKETDEERAMDAIMEKIKLAKNEASQFREVGREQLTVDLAHVERLLRRTKAERTQQASRVRELESAIAQEDARASSLTVELLAADKAFKAILNRDAQVAEKKIRAAEAQAHASEENLMRVLNTVLSAPRLSQEDPEGTLPDDGLPS